MASAVHNAVDFTSVFSFGHHERCHGLPLGLEKRLQMELRHVFSALQNIRRFVHGFVTLNIKRCSVVFDRSMSPEPAISGLLIFPVCVFEYPSADRIEQRKLFLQSVSR